MGRVRVAVARVRGHEVFGRLTGALERLRSVAEVEEVYVGRPRDQGELARLLGGYDAVIVEPGLPVLGAEFFEEAGGVRLVFVAGRGADSVDWRSAARRGVVVARVPGHCEAEAVAEFSVALLLAALRRVKEASSFAESGAWASGGYSAALSLRARRSLRSMAVGVVGLGWIGSRVASILRGLGVEEVLAYDPHVPEGAFRLAGARRCGLRELLERSDAVMIHAELNEETYHMIGDRELEAMKDGAVIVNTARGAIVDTEALLRHLDSGKVAAAALDVAEGEPIGPPHPLLGRPNVIVTPHVAYLTEEAVECMDASAVEAVKCFASGECEVVERLDKRRPWWLGLA